MKTSFATALASILTVCALSSCTPDSPVQASGKSVTPELLETVVELEGAFLEADILIYDNSALRMLVAHRVVTDERLSFKLKPGDYTVVALANLDGELVEAAVQRYESLESLCYRYCDEDPAAALMSAVTLISAGQKCRLELQPLLCEVEILSIERDFAGALADARAEDVRLYLQYVNAKAEPLRQTGFRPSEMLNCGTFSKADLKTMRCPEMLCLELGCDVGRFALLPHRSLYCYPNDDRQAGIGAPRTELVLEATVQGKTETWKWRLPLMPRGSKVGLSLVISDVGLERTEMPR